MLNMCIRYYKMVCTHIPTSIRNYIIGIHCSQCIIRQITIIRLIADLDTRIMLKGPTTGYSSNAQVTTRVSYYYATAMER